LQLLATPVSPEKSLKFNQALDRLHYAGRCHPVGRFVRFAVYESEDWVGGFVLRNTIPHVTCRDRFFGLYSFRRGGRFPSSRSGYWPLLNEIVNIGRIFVFPKAQGKGIGIRIVALAESSAIKYWKNLYDSEVIGLDCLDLATPEHAKIFANNSWTFLGRTTGHSRKGRRPSMRDSPKKHVDVPSLSKIHPSWYVYGKCIVDFHHARRGGHGPV